MDEFKKNGSFSSLLSFVREQTYVVGEDLFRQGERAHRLYYVIEGKVRLTRVGQDAVTRYLETLGPGESIGETGLLIGDFHDATAEAAVPTRLLVLERADFRKFLKEQPRAERQLNMSRDVKRRLSLPKFEWLRDDELVIFAARRHWSNLIRRIFLALLVLILVIIAYFIVPWGEINGGFSNLLAIGLGTITAIALIYTAWQVVNYRDDFFVLTTQRIVHFERVWPVRKNFEEGALSNIQDTTILQKGITANALNYGDLILQTAGETVDIDLTSVGRPVQLKDMIEKELERTRARRVASVRGDIRTKLKERLESGRLPAEETTEVEKTKYTSTASSITVLIRSVLDYFFPSSRSVSEDGSIVYWRRYWLPGFFQNWHISLLVITWTIGGILFWQRFFSGDWVPFFGWLIIEGVLFAGLLWNIEDWRNDYFKLSPSDILLVSQRPLLLERSQQEARLEDIQNLSSEIPNLLGQVFRYGHVTFETAGTQGMFELKWVRFPEEVRGEISQRQQQYEDKQQMMEARRRQDELLQWFDVYDELRNPGKRRPETTQNPQSDTDSDDRENLASKGG